jgi:PilZ domain
MVDEQFPFRREFSRVAVHLKAEVTAQGKVHRDGTMENLSLKGAFFRAANPPAEGDSVDILLRLDGTDIMVHARGFVVRAGPAGCALQFTEIIGLDSLEHLRNLILFNSHNPHQVEQEFHDHLGLKRLE